MSQLSEVISTARSGVVRLALYHGQDQAGSGTGFLSNGKLITNSHIIRADKFDAAAFTFGDQDLNPIDPVRISQGELYNLSSMSRRKAASTTLSLICPLNQSSWEDTSLKWCSLKASVSPAIRCSFLDSLSEARCSRRTFDSFRLITAPARFTACRSTAA